MRKNIQYKKLEWKKENVFRKWQCQNFDSREQQEQDFADNGMDPKKASSSGRNEHFLKLNQNDNEKTTTRKQNKTKYMLHIVKKKNTYTINIGILMSNLFN